MLFLKLLISAARCACTVAPKVSSLLCWRFNTLVSSKWVVVQEYFALWHVLRYRVGSILVIEEEEESRAAPPYAELRAVLVASAPLHVRVSLETYAAYTPDGVLVIPN